MTNADAWREFKTGNWSTKIDTRGFIQANYTPYEGDASFLAPETERTKMLMEKVSALLKAEHAKGVLDIATEVGASITA